MQEVAQFIAELTGLTPITAMQVFATVVILLIIFAARFMTLLIVRKNIDDIKRLYGWRRAINYLTSLLIILAIGRVWFPALQELGVFLGLASAGIAIAMRDPLMCIAGWVYILIRRPYIVGDRIELGDTRGDVINIRIFQTYIMECGNWIDGDQSTGRIVLIPNSAIFLNSLGNYTHGFEYIWDELNVRISFESDWRRAKEILTDIANTHAAPLCEDAQRQIRQAASQHMIFFQKLTPIVYTSVKDWGVQLTVRYLTPPRQRRGSAQRLWEAVLDSFGREPNINFAYPTQRFYTHATEGKPEMRPDPSEPTFRP